MPTGYTHPVQNGQITSLKDFALNCASAFTSVSRDRPTDETNLLKNVFSSYSDDIEYHVQEIDILIRAIDKLKNMTTDQLKDMRNKEYNDSYESVLKSNNEMLASKERYDSMLQKVESWIPPENAIDLKNFMIQQLKDSIKYDIHKYFELPEPISVTKFFDVKMNHLMEDLEYHKVKLAEILSNRSKSYSFYKNLLKSLQ